MKSEIVKVYPDDKKVLAYRYADTCMLVIASKVRDTDASIITDNEGYRYKRVIECGRVWSSAEYSIL